MSAAQSGINNAMYGKDWRQGKTQEQLEQHKLNVSNAQIQHFTYEKGNWENVTIFKANTTAKKVKNKRTGDIFISLKQASQYYNLPYSTMNQRMVGERYKRNELEYI